MNTVDENNLKKKIIEEMIVDYANALERNFDLAKRFLRITSSGRVAILAKDQFKIKEQILVYLIGKLYALEAGLTDEDNVSNKEFLDELGIPKGSLLPALKELRDKKRIELVKKGRYSNHRIPVNHVERTLNGIAEKTSTKILRSY